MSYVSKEIVDQIEKFIKHESDVEVVRGIIASHIGHLVADAERFRFIDRVLARINGMHLDGTNSYRVDLIPKRGRTFAGAVDETMKYCQWFADGPKVTT